MELKVFADSIAADAFGTIRKWLGIHSRFLHDFHFGFQSCNELLGLSVIPGGVIFSSNESGGTISIV